MSSAEPKTLLDQLDDDYDSEADSDFNPDAVASGDDAADGNSDSEAEGSEGEDEAEGAGKKRRKSDVGKTSKRTKKEKDDARIEYEEGGEGGLIKTRAQREKEKLEQKQYKLEVSTSTAEESKSIDSIWESLQSAETWKKPEAPPAAKVETTPKAEPEKEEAPAQALEFAGEIISPAPASTPTTTAGGKPPLRRPKKRSSAFDSATPPPKAKKLTTLEKSKMDWEGYVAREGIRDELAEHGKGGKGFVERKGFLDRVEETQWSKVKEGRKG